MLRDLFNRLKEYFYKLYKKNTYLFSIFFNVKKKVIENIKHSLLLIKKFFVLIKKNFYKLKNGVNLIKAIDFYKIKKKINNLKRKRKKSKRFYREFNINIYIIRDEFFLIEDGIVSLITLKNHYKFFYKRLPFFYNLWISRYLFSYYYFKHFFQHRGKKIIELFNLNKSIKLDFKQNFNFLYSNLYLGFKILFNFIKIWLFCIIITCLSFIILIYNKTNALPHFMFFWVCVGMLLYWLLSGFVFFVKKYQFSRYTSVIQRFWRRSYIIFWLIESGLLLVFFYLMVNSSQESFYMFDQGYFLKTHLFSWKLFIFKATILISLILYSYILLVNFKYSTFNKNIFFFITITIILLYLVWLETYQIFWVANFYANYSWAYDSEELIWSLEWDGRRTRILNHYIMILCILKFWHILFILGCWIFFLLRSNELDKNTYTLFSFNFQNFIIMFIMLWLFMYPWFRHTFHWLSEIPYYWFYVDIHNNFGKILFYEIYHFYYNIFVYYFKPSLCYIFTQYEFIGWDLFDNMLDSNNFIKHTLKNILLDII